MGIKEWSDKASDYLDTKGLANPAEVVNEALGGESRAESKARRDAAKAAKDKPAPELTLEERKAKAGKEAGEAYDKDRANWPLSPKKKARAVWDAEDAVTKKKGGVIRSSASKRADGIAIRGRTRA